MSWELPLKRAFTASGVAPLASAVLLAAACGEQPPLPAPRVLSIEPTQMISSGTADAIITVEALLPFTVDYTRDSVAVERSLLIGIGPLIVGNSRYENNGRLNAFIPSLPTGVYDVTLTLVSDARTATLPNAFTVSQGQWPSSYAIDTIPTQRRGVPFDITIRAQGPNASSFEGTLELAPNRGVITPSRTGKFTAGMRVETVTISASGPGIIIAVTDVTGTMDPSNPFTVN